MNQVGDSNFWALGYEDLTGAKAARSAIARVESLYGLHVLDTIVVTRPQDGSFTLEREASPTISGGAIGLGLLGLTMGLVVLQPIAGAALGAAVGGMIVAAARQAGIGDEFVNEVKDLVQPGKSALFLLTRTDNPDAVRLRIRGLGGKVLHTNVNPDLARDVQQALDSPKPIA
jgi:uncharacterized membrane protein